MIEREAEIGYVLKGFARTSETFITNEIALLERRGLRLTIFSLLELAGQQRHAAVGEIQAEVHYLPRLTPLSEAAPLKWLALNLPGALRIHGRLLIARPLRYLGALGEAFGMSFRYGTSARLTFLKEFLQAGFLADRVLASGRIRHLHAHFCHTAATVAMFASRLCDLPFSFTAHAKDIYVEEHNPGDLLPVKMRRAKFVVTCTEANRRHLESIAPGAAPVHTIHHGLDPARFPPRAPCPPEEQPLILSVGRLVEKKGFSALVEACRRLKDRGYAFRCRIVGGGGPELGHVNSAIEAAGLEDLVRLDPPVTQEELRNVYAQAAIFVLPCQIAENGDRDGIPNVLVEAMAMGLPVVSTNVSGIPELIDHDVNGWLAPQKDPDALADALALLLKQPALRHRLGLAAREKVCRAFDSEEKIAPLHRLFERCLAEADSRAPLRAPSGSRL
ncbi:MAG: glycosyltransferase family 4 protein [Blastocatellia bacterium]